MDLTMLNDAARATHLLGLALGFGVAILADLCAARSLFRPLDDHELGTLHRYHRTVSFGLTLFWSSGLVLLWLRTGFQIENFSPKLIVKLGIVTLLTVNATLIGRIGLPVMIAWRGFRYGALPPAIRLRLAVLAGMSGAGWISALVLGTVPAMKTYQWDMLGDVIGAIYFIGLGGALTMAFLAPALHYALNRVRIF